MMAENDSEIPEGKKPPKIKLGNGKGNGNSDSDKIPDIPDPFSAQSDAESAPPKVSLPTGLSKEATSPIEPSPTGISRPKDETAQIPSVQAQDSGDIQEGMLADPKSETARIDLSQAVPAGTESNEMDQTMRVDLTDDSAATASIPKVSTSRVDQTSPIPAAPDADPFDAGQTMRIDTGAEDPGAEHPADDSIQEGVPVDPGSQTMRIDVSEQTSEIDPIGQTKAVDDSELTSAIEMPADEHFDESAATMKIDLPKSDPPPASKPVDSPPVKKPVVAKSEESATDDNMKTMRVDLSAPAEDSVPTEKVSPADESMQTMRIDISEGVPSEPKSDTARVPLSETQSVKQATSSIPAQDKEEAKSKSGTIPLGGSGELSQILEEENRNIASQTMRIELDEDETDSQGSTSKTKTGTVGIDMSELMPKAGSTSKGPRAGSPKTIRIRKTDTPPPTRVLKKSPAATQEAKTGTTKIDLPEGSPSTSEKKTIRVKRSEAGVTSTGPSIKPAGISSEQKDDGPTFGIIYTLAAVIAILITGVALYVMVAQIGSIPEDGISLPWPGQI